jgi:hypothetical protein
MLTLYCADPAQRQAVVDLLSRQESTVACDTWLAFELRVPVAQCAVAVVPWLWADDAVSQIAAVKSRSPLIPFVVVTAKDADNVRRLGTVAVEEIVWCNEVERALPRAVTSARSRGALRRFADALAAAEYLPAQLRAGLVHVCRSATPVRSVGEMATAVGCHRRTLEHQWRRVVSGDPPLRLEDFLSWNLLLRALAWKRSGRAWAGAAEAIGVHQHTLARLATHYAGVRLRDLAAVDPHEITENFRQCVLGRVLRGSGLRLLG